MSSGGFEQRNPYQGSPARPWATVRLRAPNGTIRELPLQVDTGSPLALILSTTALSQLQQLVASPANTNVGLLPGGWLLITMPELGIFRMVLGYGSDAIVNSAQTSSPLFEGLIVLPFLRLVEYGGDADWFWLRPPPPSP